MHLRFREDRTTQAAARLLQLHGGRMNHMKLVKLLYLADREALLRWGRPITFDWYVSMPHGPVLSRTLDLINAQPDPDHPSYWHRYISEREGYEVALCDAPSIDQLSPAEEALLQEVFERYGRLGQWQLRDLSHGLPEWRDPEGSSVPIDLRDILRAGGLTDEDIAAIEDALEAEREAGRLLA